MPISNLYKFFLQTIFMFYNMFLQILPLDSIFHFNRDRVFMAKYRISSPDRPNIEHNGSLDRLKPVIMLFLSSVLRTDRIFSPQSLGAWAVSRQQEK